MSTSGYMVLPIYNLEGYDFYRLNDLPDARFIPWLESSPGGAIDGSIIAMWLAMTARGRSRGLRRGERIDVWVPSKCSGVNKRQVIGLLKKINLVTGIQFVCLTTSGAVFIKL